MDVAKGHISHISAAGIGLDPSGVAAVMKLNVLEDNVLDVVWLVGVASYAADAHASGPVAGDVTDMHIGAVAFDRDTVLLVVS